MNEIDLMIEQLSHIMRVDLLKENTIVCANARYKIAWAGYRVYGKDARHIADKLGISLRIVYHACALTDKAIKEKDYNTLKTIYDLCQKDLNTIQENPDGSYSLSDLYNTLSMFLPSVQKNTLQTRGKIYPKDMTATKRPCSDISSSTKAEKLTTKKAASPTSPTQRGTRSFLFTSDIAWAKRETSRNTNLTTRAEREMYYTALLRACEWGRKCDYENRKRKTELKDQNIYSSIID